ERLQCVLRCPAPDCGEKMDLELPVGDMLLPPYADSRPWHETTVGENGASYAVRFRLPTGADQEAAAVLARRDPGAAAEQLLHRCGERVAPAGEPDAAMEAWPSAVAEQIPAQMAALDPQAELELSLVCPECGGAFSALFDAAAYFARELAGQTRHLYREVHLLAFHYHWSEAEIMAMTGPKRRLYLELLAEELDRERSA